MLQELESNRLEVVLIPDCYDMTLNSRRVVISQNAAWYREFCSLYERGRRSGRKSDTLIKRENTVKALKKIINGVNDSVYTERLLDFMETYDGLDLLFNGFPVCPSRVAI